MMYNKQGFIADIILLYSAVMQFKGPVIIDVIVAVYKWDDTCAVQGINCLVAASVNIEFTKQT